MLTLSTRSQIAIGIALVLLMIITRGHHFSSLQNLPGASWAIFFCQAHICVLHGHYWDSSH